MHKLNITLENRQWLDVNWNFRFFKEGELPLQRCGLMTMLTLKIWIFNAYLTCNFKISEVVHCGTSKKSFSGLPLRLLEVTKFSNRHKEFVPTRLQDGALWSKGHRFESWSLPMLILDVSSPYKDLSLPTLTYYKGALNRFDIYCKESLSDPFGVVDS